MIKVPPTRVNNYSLPVQRTSEEASGKNTTRSQASKTAERPRLNDPPATFATNYNGKPSLEWDIENTARFPVLQQTNKPIPGLSLPATFATKYRAAKLNVSPGDLTLAQLIELRKGIKAGQIYDQEKFDGKPPKTEFCNHVTIRFLAQRVIDGSEDARVVLSKLVPNTEINDELIQQWAIMPTMKGEISQRSYEAALASIKQEDINVFENSLYIITPEDYMNFLNGVK